MRSVRPSSLRIERLNDLQALDAHQPDEGADESWQETWFLVWFDPVTRTGGYHHGGLCRVAGGAEVWSALVLEGREVARFNSLSLPPPDGPYHDMVLGPLHLGSKDLRTHAVQARYQDSGCDVVYEAFTDPVVYSMDVDGAALGSGHYESVGRVSGTFSVEGRTIDVAGFGYQDHSWGNRQYGNVLSFRWLFAVFGPDVFCNVYKVSTGETATYMPSYVYADEDFHVVSAAQLGFELSDDGHSPTGAMSTIWTPGHGGYSLRARVDSTTLHTHRPGTTPASASHGEFMSTVGFGTVEMGGRLGVCILENRELGSPAPWHRAELGSED